MKKTVMRSYANLIASVGVNIKKGQEVIIRADLDQPEFIAMLVEECYKLGAKKVEVEWNFQPLTKIHVRYRTQKTLSTVENWELEKVKHRLERLPAMIYILSEDPDGLAGMKQEKYAKSQQARYKVLKQYLDEMDNHYQWCIAAVPGVKWAKKVFPNLNKSQAMEKLWEAILYTSRADKDPIEAWKQHNEELEQRCNYLNSLNLRKLVYKSSNGTDLTVGLMEQALFMGGGEYSLEGNFFNPNIPSEEVFTTPKAGEADGIVYSSKPLSYQGQLIENFSLRFENGKVVEVKAEKNQELLQQMVTMDEGAAMLGECALVPYDSPINNSGLLFYNTLFDENASCHLALGRGFTNCVKDYDKYTLEELRNMGVNDSIIHEDFMIGTKDLNIYGITTDGQEIQIFKDGNFCI